MVEATLVNQCVVCSAPFAAKLKRARFCSRSCKDKNIWRTHHPLPETRTCPVCGKDMTGMRAHAVHCSRGCKTVGSDRRRSADGRNVARDRLRYQVEGERRRAYARDYLKRNPLKSKEFRMRRRARLAGAPTFLVTERDWRRLVARYRGACAYCGVAGVHLTRDHVTPLVRGGHQRVGNILPACAPCNFSKRTKFLIEWRHGKRAAR